jgi:hypothetical protein
MGRKLFLMVVFILAASLFSTTMVFAQDGSQITGQTDEDVDLVRVEVRNQSDLNVFIILSTIGLPVEDDPGGGFTTDIFEGRVSPQIRRLLQEIGTESGQDRFYGLSVAANSTKTFTVERGVYFHRTFSCGDKADGVVDVRSQLRLVFVSCTGSLVNAGEPTMEKISLDEGQDRVYWRYKFG